MYKFLRRMIIQPPVYIFQMGKVGSATLRTTLSQKYKGEIIHAHNYDMLTEKQKKTLKWQKRLYLPIYVICPIREPLSRNVSAFFQNFKRDTGVEYTDQKWTAKELQELFLTYYPHTTCLEWFDKYLAPVFGIDVFSSTFPIKQKWCTYRKGSTKLLVYRSDLDMGKQLDIVSLFTGINIDSWNYKNISTEKDYGEIYNDFCDSVKLPDDYISKMCNSRFCRHFWDIDEITENSGKWKN